MPSTIETIAYIAPEIPSLSATFVYSEILALEKRNIRVLPLSLRYPAAPAKEAEVQELLAKTTFLYSQNWWLTCRDNAAMFLRSPIQYWTTLLLVFNDIFEVGFFSVAAVKLIYQFWRANQVAKIAIANRCQHLHVHFANAPTQVGMYAASLSNIPFSFTTHANDLFERGTLLSEKIERAKAVITISEYNRLLLAKETPTPEKIKIIRCGVDTDRYNYLGNPNIGEKPLVKSLGRLVAKKGMDILILAAKELQEKGIDFHLEIGGDGDLREELEELVRQHNLTAKVTFKGAIAHDLVYSWLQESDIFVLACKQDPQGDKDGIPVVLMEAMAAGIPVVSTNISGIPELIEDGTTGFLAEPNDPQSLALAIQKSFDMSPYLGKITQLARQKIVDEFNIDITTDRLLEIFEND